MTVATFVGTMLKQIVKSLNFNQLFAEKILALSPEMADSIKKNPEFHNLLKLGVFNYTEAA